MAFDFWGSDPWDLDDLAEQEEADVVRRWMAGWHETSEGKKIRIKELEDSHLDHLITYFKSKQFDVSVLTREVARRENLEDKNLGL